MPNRAVYVQVQYLRIYYSVKDQAYTLIRKFYLEVISYKFSRGAILNFLVRGFYPFSLVPDIEASTRCPAFF
jgi:hypothetical protein